MKERLRHLPVELAGCGLTAAGAAAVGAAVGGGVAAVGAAAGVLLVVASYLASTLAIAWADSVNPRLVLPVGLGMYVTKFSLFGMVLVALLGTGWAGLTPMAMGIVAGVIAWSALQIWWVVSHPATVA